MIFVSFKETQITKSRVGGVVAPPYSGRDLEASIGGQ